MFSVEVYCQSMYLQIVNEKSKQPVPYVLLKKINSNYSLNADNKGKISKGQIKQGKYVLSCISYKTDTFLITSETDLIFLKENPVKLTTVEISDWLVGNKSFWVGYHKKGQVFKSVYKGPGNSHLATFIPFKTSEVVIEKIVIKGYQIPKYFVYHLTLYQAGEDGKPARQILSKKYQHASGSNTLEVELHERVKIENGGLFVGYQWLLYENKGLLDKERQNLPRVKMTFDGFESGTFLLSESGFNYEKKWVPLKYPDRSVYTPRFGLKVRELTKK